jgi:NAD(P)-dependent dehydrogenase (short-subunit alcohol dehydrogenase family)
MSVRNAVVIGGTGDIGRAVIARLQAEGLRVLCAAHDVHEETPAAMRVDITDESSVMALFEKTENALGPISLLVNCAGGGGFTPIADTSIHDWRRTLDVNLTGAFLCAREAFKRMKAREGGRLIHIGSVSDHLSLPLNAAYAASKHGLRGLVGGLERGGEGPRHPGHAHLAGGRLHLLLESAPGVQSG